MKMRDYYFGNMEFGKMTIRMEKFEVCVINEIDEIKQFETMEEAEEYAQQNDTGDYIASAHDSIEILFSESCLFNGSLKVGDLP